jgi:hypothetical protein
LTRVELANLGVARISTGSLLYRAALAQAVAAAGAVRGGAPLLTIVSYEEVQAMNDRSGTLQGGLTVVWERIWEQAPEMISIAFDSRVAGFGANRSRS